MIGDFRVAAANATSASVTPALALATAASSAASWALVVVSSVVEPVSAAAVTAVLSLTTLAFAWASVDFAVARSAFRPTVEMVPSIWPFFTVSPSATLTDVTSPEAPKLTSRSSAGASVPVVEIVRLSVCTDAATDLVVVVGVAAAAVSFGRVNHQVAPEAATTSTIVVPIHNHRRRPRVFGCPASATLTALLTDRAHARAPRDTRGDFGR